MDFSSFYRWNPEQHPLGKGKALVRNGHQRLY